MAFTIRILHYDSLEVNHHEQKWPKCLGIPKCLTIPWHLEWPKFWIPSILFLAPFGREVTPKFWGKAKIDLLYTNVGILWPMEDDKISPSLAFNTWDLDVCK